MNEENKNKLETIVSGISSMLIKEDIQFVEKSKYDELKFKLEEKDKVIDEAFKLSQELKEQIELTLNDYNKERTYENAYEQIDDIEYHYEDIKEIVEILERGKNGNS